ncbi:ATP-grasp domain-containing protein [Kitasatospora sp. NPDC056327]|uniref:ATP-grasp domain-containing protein n=1 Tax=Kitasatospora sp. NPDC056327 TaxID=3345785 RepID=UPI0035DAFD0E
MTWLALIESNTTGSGRQFCAAARGLGLRPVVLAAQPGRYPYLAEDAVDHLVLDTADREAVLAACRRLAGEGGLAGVTSSSEYFIATAAATAERLALPAPDAGALTECRHKDRQRAALEAAGVPVPGYTAVTDVEAALTAAGRTGYPVVVKPTTGSGSVGVRLCAGPAEVREAAAALLGSPVDERGRTVPATILVEEYVDGPEFSVETFDGAVVGIVAKHLGPAPHFVETGHDFPAPAAPDGLGATALAALAALGLGWGPAHTELRHGPRGPVVIEVNPRLAGGMIPTLVRHAAGVDLVAATVARAVGRPAAVEPRHRSYASIRFALADRSGTVTRADGRAGALILPGVELAELTVAPGTELRLTHSFRDRYGYAVATGPDSATAADRAARAAAHLLLAIS